MGTLVIYYKYTEIIYPEAIKKWQYKLCTELGLTGRIIIAHEGINGTAAGTREAVAAYVKAMEEHPLFNNIDFKYSEGDKNLFPRLKISVKNEIVRLGVDPAIVSAKNAGTHLTPEQAHALMAEKPENLVILDTRNTYESRVGYFAEAVIPPITNFRELPAYIDNNLEQFANKQVIMYCTAGVRCERASAYLKHKGVAQEVYQIQGGIQRYVEQYPDGFFRGKNYVFDGRVTVPINNDILTNCEECGVKYDEYTNCLNTRCNKQAILCPSCVQKFNTACSVACHEAVTMHPDWMRTKPRKVTACTLNP
jgi:predicted sulfurtransferase